MRRLLFLLSCLLGVLMALPAAPALASDFDFSSQPPIVLDVANIQVVQTYVAPMKAPNIEHTLPVTPADSVRLWVLARLKAGGTTGTARVTIRDASIVEVQLPRTTGIRGWFTTDQSQRYDGKLSVAVQIDQPDKGFTGSTDTIVTSSKSVSEDVTLDQRQATWNAMVHEMAHDLDTQLSQGIRANLGPVILP